MSKRPKRLSTRNDMDLFRKPGAIDIRKQRQIKEELNKSILQDKGDLLEVCTRCHHYGIIRYDHETQEYHCIKCGGVWNPPELPDYFIR
ncbi:hypothetical protein L4174_021230 [Photobacterium sp. CCB-ST2H9]|uniref:hypothetical protein n=1 Tax=Photobacterium sp. CCB-ST2H9 TaxID=2912855 RepID=UPI002002F1F0|nr:hypothetical protein [Photobacterium sp. CCB-ST2H9]UTM59231.1 hypothetical protein L4174_021230 [Photobacterium sp. CCB-ST2H9]